MNFGELIERQIAQGKEILSKIEALRAIPLPKNDFGDGMAIFNVPRQQPKYDENQIAALKSEMQRWQNVSLDVLRNAVTSDSTYIKKFQETISEKHYVYNIPTAMRREVTNSIDVLESVKESISLNLVDNGSTSKQSKGKVKVFVSHASADASYIKPFIEKVLKLGLELKTEEIAFTSEESYGVEPGENIANYIKENIACASVVLLMISPNYKKSEVCLNEMGAAWALEKKCISVVLPTASFKQLGWISNLDKAVKLSDKKQVASLCEKVAKQLSIEGKTKLTSMVTYIDEFVNGLSAIKPATVKQEVKTKTKRTNHIGSLKVFDVSFKSICLDEGEYIAQINVRLRSGKENISIKQVLLQNKGSFTGSSFKPLNIIEFKSYINQGVFELTDNESTAKHFVKDDYSKHSHQLLDVIVEKARNLSVSFVWQFNTIRQSDGYEELQIGGWELVVRYNVNEEVVVPLTLEPIDDNNYGMYWHSVKDDGK